MLRSIRTSAVCFAIAIPLASAACGTEARTDPSTARAARPAVAVTVAAVQASDLVERVDVVGSLAPKVFADIKSEISGTVTAVYVTEWLPVAKGAPLARLDTSEAEAAIEALKAVEAQARVGESRARREYDRAVNLDGYGLITTQMLDEARSALEAASAAVTAARAQVRTAEARLAKAFIRAPIDGVVALRRVNVGDRVENMGGGEPMFRIVDSRRLDLTMTVPAARLPAIRIGQAIEFTTDAVPGRTFTGRIEFINPSVDEASRAARVIAQVPNADGQLKGGLFVEGRIATAARPQVLQVPREALLDWNARAGTASVFVVRDGRADKRAVGTGVVEAGSVEVASGLALGEQIVVRGGFALQAGDRVTVADAPTEK